MKHAAAAKRLQRRRTKEDAHVAALTLAVHAADAVLATIESIMTSTTRIAMSPKANSEALSPNDDLELMCGYRL
jgi:hypothetical protein